MPLAGTLRLGILYILFLYILSYTGIGCPDIGDIPLAEIVTRTELKLVMRCVGSRDTWYLLCKEDIWIGDIRNCSIAGGKMEGREDGREGEREKGWA